MDRSQEQDGAGRGEVHSELSSRPGASRRASRSPLPDDSMPGEWGAAAPSERTRGSGGGGPQGVPLEGVLDRAAEALRRSGVLTTAQRHPLATLGVAFGVGFLLAGRPRGGRGAMRKGQLRGMIMATLVAALKDEAEAFFREYAATGEEDVEESPRSFGRSIARSRGPGSPGY